MINIIESGKNPKIKANIKDLGKYTDKSIRYALWAIGKDVISDTKKLIAMPKHGRTYLKRIGTKGQKLKNAQKYTASAPGEAPAVVSGELKRSLNFLVTGSKQVQFGFDMHYGKAPYAKLLEYKDMIAMTGKGCKHIEPRPSLSAAYKGKKVIFKDYFLKHLKLGIKI